MSTSNTGAAVSRMVRPIISQDLVEAKLNVLKMYKQFQRVAKQHWWDYRLQDIPLPVFREVLKKEFMKNAHIQDVRIIDRKVEGKIILYFIYFKVFRKFVFSQNSDFYLK
ncbi:unnamed protein product [Meloidogyne enterolobii]|uniref:Uncharacterized protein n=1 Tax=Meloidogyne enterolobii TaxID=390850 RepID=A0ACB1AH56_MELEN